MKTFCRFSATVFLPFLFAGRASLLPLGALILLAKARSTNYRIEPSILDSKRIGNFWLDLFTFKRHPVLTGWEFRGLIILIDMVVVYKDPEGGRPSIQTEDVQVKPLGPLQDAATIIPGVIQSVF